jgi:hypothetical protein
MVEGHNDLTPTRTLIGRRSSYSRFENIDQLNDLLSLTTGITEPETILYR